MRKQLCPSKLQFQHDKHHDIANYIAIATVPKLCSYYIDCLGAYVYIASHLVKSTKACILIKRFFMIFS